MQFRITPTERWGVTLQAGEAGGCSAVVGPAAVRLHRESVDGAWDVLRAVPFALVAGRSYELEVAARGDRVTVFVDGSPHLVDVVVAAREGGFGLKAWGSTVRFERVQVWPHDTVLTRSPAGSRIPMFQGSSAWTAAEAQPEAVEASCNPWCSQLTGLHDCNNIIGEATSHGAFLAALMDVWTTRARQFDQTERESLRRAIVTTASYLQEL